MQIVHRRTRVSVGRPTGVVDREAPERSAHPAAQGVEWIGAVGRGIAEHGPAFAAYAGVMDDEDALGGFEDDYLGGWDSLADYGESIVTDMGWQEEIDKVLPPPISRCVTVNGEGLAQDMWLTGEIPVVQRDGGGVWIFRAH